MDTPSVLIVEDNESVRSLLSTTLSEAGFSVSEAENGKQAMKICHTNFPDLIVTDILMPDLQTFSCQIWTVWN